MTITNADLHPQFHTVCFSAHSFWGIAVLGCRARTLKGRLGSRFLVSRFLSAFVVIVLVFLHGRR